jgi:hypothetical protein
MSDWGYVLVILGLVAIGSLFLLSRRNAANKNKSDQYEITRTRPDVKNYTKDREDTREAAMSEEDRTWEAASLQTNREARERDETPTEHQL